MSTETNSGLIQIVVLVLVTLVTIACGAVLSKVQGAIGMMNLFSSVLLVGSLIILSTLVTLHFARKKYEYIYKMNKKFLDEIKSEICNIPDLLISTEELIEIELEKASSEVWVITSDLFEDGVDGLFFDCINQNMRRGVVYRYFVPESPAVIAKERQMKNQVCLKDMIDFRYMNDDFFYLFAKFDFGIINPQKIGERFGFMGMPTGTGSSERYQAKISEELIDDIIGRLLQHETCVDLRSDHFKKIS